MGQINKAERAIHEMSQDKSRKKAFADVSSILMGPDDHDDQLKVVSDEDEDLDNILEKDDEDSFNDKLGPFTKVEEKTTPKPKIRIKARVRESPSDDL